MSNGMLWKMVVLMLAWLPSAWAQDEMARLTEAFWRTEAQIEAYEQKANAKDHINVLAAYLVTVAEPGWRQAWPVIENADMLLFPLSRLTELASDLSSQSQRPASDITRELLLMDRDFRQHLQNRVLPALRQERQRLSQQIAALRPAPPGRRNSSGDGADPTQASVWSGELDGVARTKAYQQFDSKGYAKLQDYAASTATLRLYPDGRIELVGSPTCKIETKVYTGGRKDAVTTTTQTTYRMDTAAKLSGERFKVEVTVVRKVRSESGQVKQDFQNTYSKEARLTKAENGWEKLLYIYNGQDSVPVVPWRLRSEIVK